MNSQEQTKETNEKPIRISRKTGRPITTWGGKRPNSGRKSRMTEQEVIQKLEPMAEVAFKQLREKLAEGDMKALQLFIQYYIGLPTQKIESKIEGNLNNVAVEVVRPHELEKVA